MRASREFSKPRETQDVVLSILTSGVAADKNKGSGSGIELPRQENFPVNTEMLPQVSKIMPMSNPRKPPRFPNELTRRRISLARPAFSKPKSRFFEPPYPSDEALSRQTSRKATSVITKSPLAGQGKEKEEDENVYIFTNVQVNQQPHKKLKVLLLVELVVFVILASLLVASLINYDLQNMSIWSLGIWNWCVLFIVMFCGRLISVWSINVLVYLVELNLPFKKKALYLVRGMKKSIQVFLWLSVVLLAWILLVIRGNNRSKKATEVLHYITIAIAGCLVGGGIWLVKTLLIKTLALSFHVKRFFDQIQESLFHQYVLQALSRSPVMETVKSVAKSQKSQLSLKRMTKDEGVKEAVVNMEKLQKIKQEEVCAWTMKRLVNIIRRTKLTISDNLNFGEDAEMGEQNHEIKDIWEAKGAAVKIFNNVAKPGSEYIEEEDLLRFMEINEVNEVFQSFDGNIVSAPIKKSALEKWVVNAYLKRKSLAHSLDDTYTAVDDLNKLASGVVLIVVIIVWNLMMGFLTTKILVFVSTQLLLVVFIFGNTVKTVFEAIIFVFATHPFDVGDRCVIDGVQMVVEEMNILTTVFLRYDNEMITYPNSVLATKPISNFYRSPEMIDSVEFAIDFCTTAEVIAALKDQIKAYIESKPRHWKPSHSVQLKDIVDMNKIKMVLYITHTINFQNIVEKGDRRSDLVLQLKSIFEELGIRYQLLPQELHVTYAGSLASTSVAQS